MAAAAERCRRCGVPGSACCRVCGCVQRCHSYIALLVLVPRVPTGHTRAGRPAGPQTRAASCPLALPQVCMCSPPPPQYSWPTARRSPCCMRCSLPACAPGCWNVTTRCAAGAGLLQLILACASHHAPHPWQAAARPPDPTCSPLSMAAPPRRGRPSSAASGSLQEQAPASTALTARICTTSAARRSTASAAQSSRSAR